MPVNPKPKDGITYLLVRVDTDMDIEQIVGKIETIENDISALTRLDVIATSDSTKGKEAWQGTPVIYYP